MAQKSEANEKEPAEEKQTKKPTRISPDYENPIYDSLRPFVESILSVSTKLQLESSRTKGVVLMCGSSCPDAQKDGLATCILPLKTISSGGSPPCTFVDNPLLETLGKYAIQGEAPEEGEADDLPELILGLCCNNWGMYYGRNALIEALLEVLGPSNAHKLSIHTARYALDFNMQALSQIVASEESTTSADSREGEETDRALHSAAFEASALMYTIEMDAIEKDTHRFQGVSKADFVDQLSKAVVQAAERTMANNGQTVTSYVLQILRHRCLIQYNLTNKRFRRARSQNDITVASQKLTELFSQNWGTPDLSFPEQIPGWNSYTQSLGGTAAILGLFCHSIDVLAGCVARHYYEGTRAARAPQPQATSPHLAERLVLTILDKDQRLLEYCFNQVYELMPKKDSTPRMYLYRRLGDLSLFSTLPCGAVALGGNL